MLTCLNTIIWKWRFQTNKSTAVIQIMLGVEPQSLDDFVSRYTSEPQAQSDAYAILDCLCLFHTWGAWSSSCIDCHMLPFLSNPVEQSIALLGTLTQLFPSSVAPPKKLGAGSEALFHVLKVSVHILQVTLQRRIRFDWAITWPYVGTRFGH